MEGTPRRARTFLGTTNLKEEKSYIFSVSGLKVHKYGRIILRVETNEKIKVVFFYVII
jgi:hypothetical protein